MLFGIIKDANYYPNHFLH